MGKFIDATEAGDVSAFQDHFNSRMSDKVAQALDACKIEVAKKFFNIQDEVENEEVVEEGNISHKDAHDFLTKGSKAVKAKKVCSKCGKKDCKCK